MAATPSASTPMMFLAQPSHRPIEVMQIEALRPT
jgi:hypothetical protein